MAINFSQQYITNARRCARWTPLYFRRKLYHPIRAWRKLRSRLALKKIYPSEARCYVTENFDKAAPYLQKHKWVFIENVLEPEFHRELCENWPKKYYFDPPRDLEKSYNRGFYWRRGDDPNLRVHDPYGRYPSLVKFLNYLNSDEFLSRMEKLVGGYRKLAFYSFILTDASPGAEVIPHMDSIAKDPKTTDGINMVFFIDATGGKNSGGLSLYRDNEAKDIIFEPENLRNSVLIYNTFVDFYHGFPPLAKNKFRWTVGASFNDRSNEPR